MMERIQPLLDAKSPSRNGIGWLWLPLEPWGVAGVGPGAHENGPAGRAVDWSWGSLCRLHRWTISGIRCRRVWPSMSMRLQSRAVGHVEKGYVSRRLHD